MLDLAARKLQRMASVLALPGPHPRDGRPGELLGAAEKLAGLTAAEGLEASLLRRPRAEVRRRVAAAAQIGRCLFYADQLVPLLPGAERAIPAALDALAADVGRVAQSVRRGAAAPRLAGQDRVARAQESETAEYRAGRITLTQFQASLRLHEVLADLAEATDRVAQSAPKASGKPSRVGVTAAPD